MLQRPIVVIPAYRAALTLPGVLARIPPAVLERLVRIVAVDDGSDDDTWQVLGDLATRYPKLKPLRHETNRGYGVAIKTLLTAALDAGADGVAVLHADGQYAPELLPEMLAPLDSGSGDLVQGSRILGGGALTGGMPRYKYVANRSLTWLENRAFGLRLAEYHSGYMAYAAGFLRRVPWRDFSDSFDFDLEMIAAAKAHARPIVEVPIPTHYGDEVSHLRSIPYGLRVLRVVLRYLRGHYKP